jgi:steroid delta-isomerase-like uncharacterized protein
MNLVRSMMSDVFNDRSYDRIPELLAEDFVQHGSTPGAELRGQDAWLENIRQYHDAFSDLVSTEEMAFSDGEYVCSHYTYRGTNDGDFMGIPASNETVTITGTVITRIEEDRIAERWVTADILGLLQQIGSVPAIDEMGTIGA